MLMQTRRSFVKHRAALLAPCLAGLACLALAGAEPAKVRRSALPLDEARAAFRVAPGLRVELVAAEPQIVSPVAMAFDEDGRLWVVEMRDYPNGPAKGQPAEGRIVVLEDRDGDGRFETSTVFADRLLFANGVLPWKGGALVTAAPYIIHLRDTDGDGKADQREVLFEGFATQNPQLRVSHPILGLDNWIYVANGLRGGQVKRSGDPRAKPVNLSGRDFRFELVHDRHEAVSGMGQYGNCFDDWGQRFVCDNRHHLRHVVLAERYSKRNPFLAVPEVLEDISDLPLGQAGAGAKTYPISKNWTTSNLHAGTFTAACSVFIYRGNLLPREYQGCAFTCDPTGNLVHQEVLRPHGATFRSRPPRQGVEFLASMDDWCRPVFLSLGPDGALYVVDMCRAVIEHPEWMPPELRRRADLTWGKDRGRIWRIMPEGYQGKAARPHLSKATTPELVKLLTHPNAWWRTTAQRLLLERQDRSAIAPLQALCRDPRRDPRGRAQAAWLLESLDALDQKLVLGLLGDDDPHLREQGAILAERWLRTSPALRSAVIGLATDADGQVLFQAALSLGECRDNLMLPALAAIARKQAQDPWVRVALASSVPGRAGAMIDHFIGARAELRLPAVPPYLALLRELALLVGARRDTEEVSDVLRILLDQGGKEAVSWQLVGLDGLAEGMARRGTQLGTFLQGLPASRQALRRKAIQMMFGAAALTGAGRPLPQRLTAIRLLAHLPWAKAGPALTRLLTEDPAQEIRLAAARSLAAQPGPEVTAVLLKSWRGSGPALRREVSEALLRQPERTLALLKEIEAGRVRPGDLDAARVRQLLASPRADIRDLSRRLLRDSLPADRKQVLVRYQAALYLKGDGRRGREIFKKNCATCHRIAGIGVDVGPDISDSRTRTEAALLTDILNPNQAIDGNYVNYLVTLKDGRVLTGILASESAASLTLRRAEGQTDVVLRQDVEEVASTGQSLMPEGLEKSISVREMADLLAFVKGWRYLGGEVPGVGAAPP
jgi:putative membrane-bound dehydrogenase-like protein